MKKNEQTNNKKFIQKNTHNLRISYMYNNFVYTFKFEAETADKCYKYKT